MKEILDANRKKVWTNVTLRLDQDTKLKILNRANIEGLNTNQFLMKVVVGYLSDLKDQDKNQMIDGLLELVNLLQRRVIDSESECHKLMSQLGEDGLNNVIKDRNQVKADVESEIEERVDMILTGKDKGE